MCTQGMWCGGLGVCVHRVCSVEGVCTQGMWCGGCVYTGYVVWRVRCVYIGYVVWRVCVHRVCGVGAARAVLGTPLIMM